MRADQLQLEEVNGNAIPKASLGVAQLVQSPKILSTVQYCLGISLSL